MMIYPVTPLFSRVPTAPTSSLARCSWSGTVPYLDTEDGAASYGEGPGTQDVTEGPPYHMPTFVVGRLPATTAPAGVTGARIERQVYVDMALDVDGLVGATFGIDSQAGYFYYNTPPDTRQTAAMWVTLSTDLIFSDPSLGDGQDLPAMLAVLAAGQLDLSIGGFGNSIPDAGDLFRVSMIRLVLIEPNLPNLSGGLLDDRVHFWGS